MHQLEQSRLVGVHIVLINPLTHDYAKHQTKVLKTSTVWPQYHKTLLELKIQVVLTFAFKCFSHNHVWIPSFVDILSVHIVRNSLNRKLRRSRNKRNMKIKKIFLHVFYSSESVLKIQWKRYSSIILKGWGKYLNRNNSFCLTYRIHSQSTPTFPLKTKHIETTNQILHKWLSFSRYFRCSTNCIFGSNRTKQSQFIYQSCHPNTVFKSQFSDAIEDDFFPRRCNKQSL